MRLATTYNNGQINISGIQSILKFMKLKMEKY